VDGDAAARAIIAAETFFREGAFLLGGLDQAD
jgi:hypothetical protein